MPPVAWSDFEKREVMFVCEECQKDITKKVRKFFARQKPWRVGERLWRYIDQLVVNFWGYRIVVMLFKESK
jgi:hypothetical protein